MATLSYNRTSHTLNCVSSGGPVNTVFWRNNDAEISDTGFNLRQTLDDATTSTYSNLLTVTSDMVENHTGLFSCTVSNSRGSSPHAMLKINGTLFCVCMFNT